MKSREYKFFKRDPEKKFKSERKVYALVDSCLSQRDLDALCDSVKADNGGNYPDFWYKKIINTGLISKVLSRFSPYVQVEKSQLKIFGEFDIKGRPKGLPEGMPEFGAEDWMDSLEARGLADQVHACLDFKHKVVACLDLRVRKDFFVCNTLEAMEAAYGIYISGEAMDIKWYRASVHNRPKLEPVTEFFKDLAERVGSVIG